MDGKTKMAFRFETGLPLAVQIEDCAVKAFVDDFGIMPTICEVPEAFVSRLPDFVGEVEVRAFMPPRLAPLDEYWLGVEETPTE